MRSFDLPSMDWGGIASAGFMHKAGRTSCDKHSTGTVAQISWRVLSSRAACEAADMTNPGDSARYIVGLAESREAKRSVRIGADKQLRNSQFQYEMGLSSGSEKRR